jgi:hypothetical protein
MLRSDLRAYRCLVFLALGAACQRQSAGNADRAVAGDSLFTRLAPRLPTGVRLDPAAQLARVGAMPLTMRLAPEGDRVVLSLSGYGKQGLQVIDALNGRVIQEIDQPSAFVGLAFSPDGHTLYSTGQTAARRVATVSFSR